MATINGKEIQITYAVCYDPDKTFNPFKFHIEAEFDSYKEAKEWARMSADKRIYVEAAVVKPNGDLEPCYWGRSLQHALSNLKKGEKL